MSIASEITSMGENLKKDYQSIANLGADLTNVDKNIENIAELLDGVYDNLPKTEYQEGTEVNLGKTIKGKLDFENGVVGIGQTEQDSRQGYNLCQAKLPTMTNSGITITNNNDGTFTINGTNSSTGTTTFRLNQSTQNGIDNLQNYEDGTYTLDLGIQNENLGINLMQNSTWTNFISTGFNVRLKSQAITNATNTFIYIGIKGSATLNNVVIKPMLVKGSYTASTIPSFEQYGASPSPSYPQTINSVTGNQDVVVSSSNVLTNATWTNGKYLNSNDEEVDNAGWKYTDYINIGQDEWMYRPSAVANAPKSLLYDVNKNKIAVLDVSNATYNLSNYNNAYYIRVSASTSSSPELYITPTSYQLSLGDIELNAIGDYKDELIYDVDEDKVYKNEKIGKRLLKDVGQTGASWNKSGLSTSDYFCGYIDFQFVMKESSYYILSNKLINQLYSVEPNDTECIANNALTVNLRIKASRLSENSVTGLVNYLQNEGSDIMIYFILNTPTLTEITDTNLHNQVKALYNAHSNNGTTIITSNGDLPMIIKVRGLKGE